MNQKILGAFVVGFAMIAGAYTVSNFNAPSIEATDNAFYTVAEASPQRTYVTVTDNDNNGIEDWREEFVNTTPLVIDPQTTGPAEYIPPETITEQVGIQLFQNVLQAKGRGNIGPNSQQVVTDTADLIRDSVSQDYIYQRSQIIVVASNDDAIRTYANTMGQILINNNVSGSEGELVIIDRALRTENPDELQKLEPIITMYKNLRDQSLATPVPAGFEKQHLDLINVYNAVFTTLDGMKQAFSDPVVALLRIQRYKDDVKGLGIALQNTYNVFIPYARLFSESDPATVFLAFSPQ